MKPKLGTVSLIPLAAIAVGVVFAYMGLKYYGFWHPKRGPMPGLYPTIVGIGLAAIGVAGVAKSLWEKAPDFNLRDWYVALSVALIIASSYLVGMLPALGVYVLVWLRLVQKAPWKTVAVVLAAVFAIVYGVFILWLQVPFETGVIHRTLWPAY